MADGADDATGPVHLAHEALDVGVVREVEHRALAADEVHRRVPCRVHFTQRQAALQSLSCVGIVEEGKVGGHHILVIAPHRWRAALRTGDVHVVATGPEHVIRTRQFGKFETGFLFAIGKVGDAGDHGQDPPSRGRYRALHEVQVGHRAACIRARLATQVQRMHVGESADARHQGQQAAHLRDPP
ncbi:MAG TPA: hypothetical protein VGE09_10550 [Pseudoxanthomonas sp.]